MLDLPSINEFADKYGLLEAQARHRISVLKIFGIKEGERVLEIGCGQGDCTVVLAHFVGSNGHVDAIDPAPLDYGSPETLGQAQERIKRTDIGDRIAFHQAHPLDFLSKVEDGAYDAVVMCHCLWYFSSKEEVRETFGVLKGKAKRLCVAEWGLQSREASAQPHILTALARATCEAHIPHSDHNIRTMISPATIKALSAEAGRALETEKIITPEPGLQDGTWESSMLLHTNVENESTFMRRAGKQISSSRIQILLDSMLESVKVAVNNVGGTNAVTCMDVWIGVFT